MKTKRPAEAVTGRFSAMPHALLDSTAFMGASHRTRSLILELMRQHDGKNNGHLHLALAAGLNHVAGRLLMASSERS